MSIISRAPLIEGEKISKGEKPRFGTREQEQIRGICIKLQRHQIPKAPFGNHHISKCDIYILKLGQNTWRALFGNHISYISAYKPAMSHCQTSNFRVHI